MGDGAQTDPEMHSVTTQSVNLRAIEISDLEVFFSHQSDPIAHHLAQFPPREREAFLPIGNRIFCIATSVVSCYLG